MHTFFIVLGLFTAILFFLIDKNMHTGVLPGKKNILKRFEKNKEKEQQLQAEFEHLVQSYEAWSQKAFPHLDVTYSEYLELLKEKSSIEYSDTEFEKLRSGLKSQQIVDYAEKIKNQEEAVIAFQAHLNCQKKKLQSLNIANAS